MADKRISELEDISVEMFKTEKQSENKDLKTRLRTKYLIPETTKLRTNNGDIKRRREPKNI